MRCGPSMTALEQDYAAAEELPAEVDESCQKNSDVPKSPLPENGSLMRSASKKAENISRFASRSRRVGLRDAISAVRTKGPRTISESTGAT